ncbi:hypothetical protein EVAR_71748_1 [Eumeta japonica]|uniref:Uncharacterized protein n=1 Tax=Eumeta variegata TaxID=151549 RepID=A0A4C1TEL1_EUMVA|nr:hypothetical protein EVAR_71748_1 [Eumeta japonica]
MNGPTESEVESLLMSPCWGPHKTTDQDQYLLDGHKLLLTLDSPRYGTKNSLDVLDNLLMNSSSLNALSDLKPLPHLQATGHLSINGISGHHYHAIAQRLPDESNNNYIQSAYHTATTTPNSTSAGILGATTIQLAASSTGASPHGGNGLSLSRSHNSSTDHNIVSSSTCLPESVLSSDADACLNDGKLVVSQQDSLVSSFLPQSPVHPSSSTLQSLLTHGYMPLLQNRLQNGPPTGNIKSEAPSSTSFCNELTAATSTSASPPGSVVSTTDNLMINPRYLTNPLQYQISMKSDGICSPI